MVYLDLLKITPNVNFKKSGRKWKKHQPLSLANLDHDVACSEVFTGFFVVVVFILFY